VLKTDQILIQIWEFLKLQDEMTYIHLLRNVGIWIILGLKIVFDLLVCLKTSAIQNNARSPQEIEVNEAMKVVKHSCSIPWKTNPPDLSNNGSAVKTQQKKTNSLDYLSKKGTSISEINAVFQDQIKKSYIEEITHPADMIEKIVFTFPTFQLLTEVDQLLKLESYLMLLQKQEMVDVESHHATSKARVAPIKTESVLCLKLDSAVIGLRLGHAVALAYQISPKQIYYWTDSPNVLYWINTPANQIKTFVSNWVGEIQSDSDAKQWRHDPTDRNPADVATRDISLSDLATNHLWRKGPDWLKQDKSL
jgi:hypothetical protein